MLNTFLLRQYPVESAARASETKETVRNHGNLSNIVPEWRNKNLLPEKSVARGCKPVVTEEAEVTASTLPGVP